MDQKDKANFEGKIKKCLKQMDVYIHKHFKEILPVFPLELNKQLYKLIWQKLKATSEIYEQEDIFFMIVVIAAGALKYEELKSRISPETTENGFVKVGELRDFVDESEYTNIANKIIEELEDPTKSYALVPLPNVELTRNIKVAKGLFLAANIADYFRFDDKNGNSDSQLLRRQTYLLIEQAGWSWRIFEQSPTIHKKILLMLKTFLGLSMIAGIFDTSRAYQKEKQDIAIGVFSVADDWSEGLWYEGASSDEEESGVYDPISEDHPDFEDMRASWAGGDPLAEFCFQRRFFFQEKISLSDAHIKLLRLISIAEYATKPSFNLITGKIVKPLIQFEKLETPEEFLEKRINKIRIILDSEDDYARRIKTASLWYFEGYCAEDETFKFILYTIAIESLFGRSGEGSNSKDKKGNPPPPLTQTLSDRCGFTLGESLKQKEKITKDFTRIYKIRSEIVHRRKVILKENEKKSLKQLEDMTKEIIRRAIATYG